MFLNDVRWIILTIMWGITMYFFIAKARQKNQQPQQSAVSYEAA
jgi:preprotein translocase subunit YajC